MNFGSTSLRNLNQIGTNTIIPPGATRLGHIMRWSNNPDTETKQEYDSSTPIYNYRQTWGVPDPQGQQYKIKIDLKK